MHVSRSPRALIVVTAFLAAAALSPHLSTSASAAASKNERLVNMMDACDPETFNAMFGPGTCVREGGVRLDHFIQELLRHQSVGGWMFAPNRTTARLGDTFVAVNHGGEVHTFTEVDEFGGGFIPELNDLAGEPVPAPECFALDDDDFVPPGASYREDVDTTGTHKFQCCIHPWMRLEARVNK